LEASRTSLKEVKITVDDVFVDDSQIVTNTVNRDFLHGSDNLIAGKLLDQPYSIKIEGTNKNGVVIEKEIKIPAKNTLGAVTDQDVLNQNRYLERLWAYLTLKKLQIPQASNQVKVTVAKTLNNNRVQLPIAKKKTDQEKIEELALNYHFVTNLTSLVITKQSFREDNFMTAGDISTEQPLSVQPKTSTVPKSLACRDGTLELFSQTYLRGKEKKLTSSLEDMEDFGLLVSSMKISGIKTNLTYND
jgi:hypothetical protein